MPGTREGGLLIGRIGRARGLRGDLIVRLTNPDSEALVPGRVVRAGDDWETARPLAVAELHTGGAGPVVRFEGVADRTAAEALRGLSLFVAWKDLPSLGGNEFYYEELRGFEVLLADGTLLGHVAGMFATSADMMVVRSPDGREHYIPVLEGFVNDIDRTARRVVVEPPEGLLDLP